MLVVVAVWTFVNAGCFVFPPGFHPYIVGVEYSGIFHMSIGCRKQRCQRTYMSQAPCGSVGPFLQFLAIAEPLHCFFCEYCPDLFRNQYHQPGYVARYYHIFRPKQVAPYPLELFCGPPLWLLHLCLPPMLWCSYRL